jgi:hypothetical protein
MPDASALSAAPVTEKQVAGKQMEKHRGKTDEYP